VARPAPRRSRPYLALPPPSCARPPQRAIARRRRQAQGKSVSGLEDAIVADASSHLDATQLANLKSHLDDIVNRTGPAGAP